MTQNKDTILVLGVGNTLLSDEGVGVRVIEALYGDPACETLGLKLMDGGTMGISLLVDMEDAGALVVVDAAQLKREPGAVAVFEGEDMDSFLRNRGRSPHDIGLDDLMDGLRLRGAMPQRRALVALQPGHLGVGEDLTSAVRAAMPDAVSAVLDIARAWRSV